MANTGDELVNDDQSESGATLNDALLSGEDLISPKVKAERALTAQLVKATEVMSSLLGMEPVDRFKQSDDGEPECLTRINTRMAELQWKIAQYVLDAALDRLPDPKAQPQPGRSIVVRTLDAGALQKELQKRLKKAA